MNKKRLSVVMAGAMLASSVAPVLAADAEVNKVEMEKGVLISELTNLIWNAPRFSNDARVGKLTDSGNSLVGRSTYAVQIGNTLNENISAATVKETNTPASLQKVIKEELESKNPGDVVKLVDLGSRTVTEKVDGKDVELVLSTNETTKYTKEELVNANGLKKELTDINAKVSKLGDNILDLDACGYNSGKNGFVIKYKASLGNDKLSEKEVVLTEDTDRYNFEYYYTGADLVATAKIDGTNPATSGDFYGFPKAAAKHLDIANKVLTEYTISTAGSVYDLSEIYDAPFLTEKGQFLLDSAKAAYNELKGLTVTSDSTNKVTSTDVKVQTIRVSKDGNSTIGTGAEVLEDLSAATLTNFADSKDAKTGVYKIRVEILNAAKVKARIGTATTWKPSADDYDVYYITSKSGEELLRVLKGLDALSPSVDKLVGTDRYATAVKIAKEVKLNGGNDVTKDIVLVNGNSLVDGLAAAPLASSLSTGKKAPILLTEANSLPTATKRYLKELIDQEVNKDVTVHIVGGNGVISNSIQRELKDLGLKVERLAGEDREGTSMAVAEKIADVTNANIENAFVVGATGEADAMSISGKAAELKTPIIVSGFEGLSEETLDELDGVNVTVLGGDASVSDAEYETIDAVAGSIKRISGSDRKETNAKIISTFYNNNFAGSAKSVLVAKDDELVDALTASNLSAQQNAPIVLATSELSKAQLDAVVTNAKDSKKVYQIGGGVAPSVVKAVAEALNLI